MNARMRSGGVPVIFLLIAVSLPTTALADVVLRGRFRVDLEPVAALEEGVPYPLDEATAYRRILQEASAVFAATIYGWDFEYEIGEAARGISESFTLNARGAIPPGDAGLRIADAETEDYKLYVWAEYRLDEAQRRRWEAWNSGEARRAQGTGSAPLSHGVRGKAEALEDAARGAIRALLRLEERNRPKEARGGLALAETPRYWVDEGRWMASARFRLMVGEVVQYRFY